jgi:hypothetical protein
MTQKLLQIGILEAYKIMPLKKFIQKKGDIFGRRTFTLQLCYTAKINTYVKGAINSVRNSSTVRCRTGVNRTPLQAIRIYTNLETQFI